MGKSSQIMQGYTDMHCHVLPGVDDGSQNMEESIEMLRIAYRNQIRRIIVTPHNKPMRHNVGQEKINELIAQLTAQMKREKIEIAFYPGNELYYCDELVENWKTIKPVPWQILPMYWWNSRRQTVGNISEMELTV